MPEADTWSEDSQGKHKPQDARGRSRLLYLALICGLCAGFVCGQYGYFWFHVGFVKNLPGYGSGSKVYRALSDKQPAQRISESNTPLSLLLQKIAPAQGGRPREVLIAISNFNLVRGGHLGLWLEGVKQAKISNYLVVAIDKELEEHLTANGHNVYHRDISIDKSQEGTGDNHAISALKFKIILEFLELGWNVLLSDVDIVVVQNPFDHLWRDHDLEGMSDGFDDPTAYGRISGLDDPSMGWARYAQGTEHLNLNSGCFYLVANEHTKALMARVAARLAVERAWDQSVYNQEIFFLAHGPYTAPNVSVRVMEIHKFMNSKVLFKFVRHQPRGRQPTPVMVHINYHPDKFERMRAVFAYLNGDAHALKPFPGGSEPGS